MAKRRKRTAKTNAPTKRELQILSRLKQRAGSREELLRWLDQCPKLKRGRPRNDFFSDFSISDGPAKGLYLARFKMGGAAPTVVVIVRPKAHRVKPGGPISTWVESQPKNGDFPTTHQAIREIVERVLKLYEEMSRDETLSPAERAALGPRRLGWHVGAIARRLTRDLRAAGKQKAEKKRVF
jgi:hypothetical protein